MDRSSKIKILGQTFFSAEKGEKTFRRFHRVHQTNEFQLVATLVEKKEKKQICDLRRNFLADDLTVTKLSFAGGATVDMVAS